MRHRSTWRRSAGSNRATALLYTDGLVERPEESIDRGLERLSEAVLSHHSDDPGSLSLGPLLAAMLEGERRDDVCLLDIRAPMDLE